jgi:hypothetical protein
MPKLAGDTPYHEREMRRAVAEEQRELELADKSATCQAAMQHLWSALRAEGHAFSHAGHIWDSDVTNEIWDELGDRVGLQEALEKRCRR